MKILTIGPIKDEPIRVLEKSYLTRMQGAWPLKIVELPRSATTALEATEVLKVVNKRDYLICLDERGREFTSPEFAQFIVQRQNDSQRPFIFAIGGAEGWDLRVRERADLVMALAKLTFPHQLARLILIEQIYRAYTLTKGIAYHK